ncbi:hypothetical protein VTJ04DRAFT_937 [Mycothermus thermophilus]|uniref:uncharacterized protein n=1 Tax=Humicola insolens TaxID=85995 RepID=UPI0037432F84
MVNTLGAERGGPCRGTRFRPAGGRSYLLAGALAPMADEKGGDQSNPSEEPTLLLSWRFWDVAEAVNHRASQTPATMYYTCGRRNEPETKKPTRHTPKAALIPSS